LGTDRFANLSRAFAVALLAPWPLGAAAQPAEEPSRLPPAPGFRNQAALRRADEVMEAWTKWNRADRNLEPGLLQLPMGEARQMLGRSLRLFQDFENARGAYSEAVAAHIENGGSATDAVVRLDRVFLDEISVLAAGVEAMQERLARMQGSPQWLEVRRFVLADLDRALQFQSNLRQRLLASAVTEQPTEAISAREYRECERRLVESLGSLWSGYYLAMAAVVEQKPPGSVRLTALQEATTAAVGRPAHPMEGVWIYLEGSRLFNGAGEPRQVLLELWVENGLMLGRYRAQLADFSGTRKVDLRLRGTPTVGGPVTLRIESQDPAGAGQVVLEGPAVNGVLTLSRIVPAGSPTPRGREMLMRR
jgi:hypothetical protein